VNCGGLRGRDMNQMVKIAPSEFDYKQVIVTRQDLKLSPGKLAVQVAHAAVECALMTRKNKSLWFSRWDSEGAKKVVVKVPCLDDFFVLKEEAQALGISAVVIADAGLTEVPAGTETVLGLGPAPNNLIDQVTGDLSLL
jgi:peptidyl-tRNA hydrolase, PTH2 family